MPDLKLRVRLRKAEAKHLSQLSAHSGPDTDDFPIDRSSPASFRRARARYARHRQDY